MNTKDIAVALAVGLVIGAAAKSYKQNNLSGSVESRHAGMLELPDEASPLPPSVPLWADTEHRSERQDSESRVSPAQSNTNAVVFALIAEGYTAEEAEWAVKAAALMQKDSSKAHDAWVKSNTKTNVNLKRFPMFEE